MMTNNNTSTSKLRQPTTVVQKKTFTLSKPLTAESNQSISDSSANILSKLHDSQSDRKRRIENHGSTLSKSLIANQVQISSSPRPVYSSEIIDVMKKKRQDWETKERLENMETLNTTLVKQIQSSIDTTEKMKQELFTNEQRIRELEDFLQELQGSVVKEREEKFCLKDELHNLHEKLKQQDDIHQQSYEYMQKEYESKLKHSEWNLENIKKALSICQNELNQSKDKVSKLESCIVNKDSHINLIESENQSFSSELKNLERTKAGILDTLTRTQSELSISKERITTLEQEFHTGELVRKRLHNQVQELKGNIRVFCRVRPLLKQDEVCNTESDDNCSCRYIYSSDAWTRTESIEVVQTSESSLLGSDKQIVKNTPFSFDKVFPPTTTQEQVFEEISQLVQSVLDGYRVCIFAYGQTGSGKTFTMEGPPGINRSSMADDSISMGMIPRSVMQIFESSQQSRSNGWEFTIEASFLEIYNEIIYDLLATEKNNKKLDIKHIPNTNKTIVQDLTIVTVTCTDQVFKLLRRASENRTTGETQCNERSSRSHSVFILQLKGENSLTTEKFEGQLNLVDLAGSERLSQSGSTGERLKETQAINKSLSSLGDVIMALGKF